MIIGIDARPLIEKKTGIGYYLYYLLENILENDKENKYILFSDRKIYFDITKYNNVTVVEDSNKKLKKTLWYMFNIKNLCTEHDVDVFWGTQHVLPFGLNKIKTVLTIHDLVAFDMPETMHSYNRLINKMLIPMSIRKADQIIAVSKSTKKRIMHHFGNKMGNKIEVIYEDVIVDTDYSGIEQNYLQKLGIGEKQYLLFVGTVEPRKNIITLVKALKYINEKTGIKLVICGKYGWKNEEEKKIIEENMDKIIFLNYVGEKEKNYLMNKSFSVVLPSKYEGFGLPILEALKNNTIAMVANNTSLIEIIEEECLQFDTFNSDQLAKRVIELYENKELYNKAYLYCQKRKDEFDWGSISKKYINVLKCI